MIEQTKIEHRKLQLEEYYNQWRKLNWNKKEEKNKILAKIDKCFELIEESDKIFVANFQIRIAYSFPTEDYFEFAEKYFLKVMKKIEHFVNHTDILIITFEGLGDLYFNNKMYDKASIFYSKLLKVGKIVDFNEEDILQMRIALLNHSKDSHIDKAEVLLTEAYKFSDEEMDHLMATKTSYYLGLAKYKLEKYTEAKPYLEKALVRYKRYNWDCKEINRMLNDIENIDESKPISTPF